MTEQNRIFHRHPCWRIFCCRRSMCIAVQVHSRSVWLQLHIYRPQTKIRKGNVITHVCQSFLFTGAGVSAYCHGGVCHTHSPWTDTPSQDRHPPSWADTPSLGRPPPWSDTPWTGNPLADTPAQCMLGYTPPAQCMLGYTPPLPSTCWDTVNKRAVRIPPECILVSEQIHTVVINWNNFSDIFFCTDLIQFKVLTTLPIKFKGFLDTN